MRVPDTALRCVVFTACASDGERRLNGTAFLVVMFDENAAKTPHFYFVTARHVIDQIAKKGDGTVYLRMNKREETGEAEWLTSSIEDWRFHPDERNDVAAIALPGWSREFDHAFVPTSSFVTAESARIQNIGIGDELFFPGLFVKHFGATRNTPIVRFGNIAAVPGEPARTRRGYSKVYLAEARSIGGLSGSPVFVYIPSDRDGPSGPFGGDTKIPLGGGETFFLGLVHGHWDVDCLQDVTSDFLIKDSEKVNMGIAVVVPAETILELLNIPEFEEQREAKRAKWAEWAKTDVASVDETQQNADQD